MCKICLKRTLDVTFLDCLASTFCDVIGELLPEWACLTLQGGTTFLLTSNLADIPVSRMRKLCLAYVCVCVNVSSLCLPTLVIVTPYYQSYHRRHVFSELTSLCEFLVGLQRCFGLRIDVVCLFVLSRINVLVNLYI